MSVIDRPRVLETGSSTSFRETAALRAIVGFFGSGLRKLLNAHSSSTDPYALVEGGMRRRDERRRKRSQHLVSRRFSYHVPQGSSHPRCTKPPDGGIRLIYFHARAAAGFRYVLSSVPSHATFETALGYESLDKDLPPRVRVGGFILSIRKRRDHELERRHARSDHVRDVSEIF